jgi:hypothetical protein
MAEFFNIGEVQKNKIPLIAVQTFLEEKQLNKHIDKIHSLFGEDLNAKYSINEYQKVLDAIIPEKEEYVPEPGSGDLFEPVIVEEHDIELPDEDKIELQSDEKIKDDTTTDVETLRVDKEDTLTQNEQEVEQAFADNADVENKPTKFRIKVKENNEIEKIIENLVDETHKEMQEEEKLNEEENNIFSNFEENIVEDIEEEMPEVIKNNTENDVEENIQEEQEIDEENNDENEFDKAAEKAEAILNYEKRIYDEFLEDKEVKDIYETADKNLKEIEDKLDMDEEESESMLKNILYNDKDDKDYFEKNIQAPKINQSGDDSRKMNITELLEHKDMTKIIEVVFDYDIEEFSSTMEDITSCNSLNDALAMITKY